MSLLFYLVMKDGGGMETKGSSFNSIPSLLYIPYIGIACIHFYAILLASHLKKKKKLSYMITITIQYAGLSLFNNFPS